ncbi:hypothetical protein BH23CHL7_BH23CHL7_00150 [soil metagenome]
MSFSLTDQPTQQPAINTTRLKRQLTEQAIDAASKGDWSARPTSTGGCSN